MSGNSLKNRVLILPALLALLLLASFRYAGGTSRYTSAAGHFSIDFPGKPSETIKADTATNGKPVNIHFVTCFPNDSEGYMVDWVDMHSDYPKGKTIKHMLEDGRDGALRSIGAIHIVTITTNMGKEPYIEFSFDNKDYTGKGRIYIVNKFQYSIITLFSQSGGVNPPADNFIRSFKHLS